MHFERQNAFQNAQNYILFPEKKTIKKNVCAYPYLKIFRPVTRNTLA